MKLKKIAALISCSMLGLGISYADTQANTESSNKTTTSASEMDSNVGYVVGYQVGSGLYKQKLGLNSQELLDGFKDAVTGSKAKLSSAQMQQSIDSFQKHFRDKQIQTAKENLSNSTDFMATIAKISNVTKVNDNVYYQTIKQGTGKKPNSSSNVTIAYQGTTPVQDYEKDKTKTLKSINQAKLVGPTFDSNANASFPLTSLIECWKDAIPEIPTGSTVILYCSPSSAYGANAPASIGPNQALTFKITLKSFK